MAVADSLYLSIQMIAQVLADSILHVWLKVRSDDILIINECHLLFIFKLVNIGSALKKKKKEITKIKNSYS